jgi:coproporphyrinogen III oxidase
VDWFSIASKNPMVPTVHANWRYFEMYDDNGNVIQQWFGGGQDLTPYYLFEEDATLSSNKQPVINIILILSKYKKQCDYFWNAHRNEAHGIGGLFSIIAK